MGKGEMYYIGKVEKMCNISKKTLRYYDEINILSPDKTSNENGYRCYSENTVLSIPIIKYCKQSGFKLEEIKGVLNNDEENEKRNLFKEKIRILEEEEKALNMKIQSIKDWHTLMREADFVKNNKLNSITVKFLEKKEMIFLDQSFEYDYKKSILNIDFTNYVEHIENAITGPVILKFSNYEEKRSGKSTTVRILQKNLIQSDKDKTYIFEGGMFVSTYHRGAYSNIEETYEKMLKWAKENEYKCEDVCYERYVIDYWTYNEEEKFITEVLLKVKE